MALGGFGLLLAGVPAPCAAEEISATSPRLLLERAPNGTWSLDLRIARLRVGRTPPGEGQRFLRTRLSEGGLIFTDHARGEAPVVVRLDALKGSLVYADRTLQVEDLQWDALGGTWQQAGRFEFDGETRFDLTLRVAGVALNEFLAALTGRAMAEEFGVFGGEGRFQGPWAGLVAGLDGVAGAGRMALRGGILPYPTVFQSLWDALFGFLPGIPPPPLDFAGAAPTRLNRFSQSFQLREGRIHTEDLEIDADDYRVTARGSTGLDGTVDYQGFLTLTLQGMQKLFAMASVSLPTLGFRSPARIPLRTSGSLAAPRFRADASGLPLSTVRLLLGAVKGAGPLLGDTAGKLKSATEGVGRLLGRPKPGASPKEGTH